MSGLPTGITGAILAGGQGRRMGGAKPTRELAGRPLISYPIEALASVCTRVAVVAKPDTELGALGEAERWDEPADPQHPLGGLVYALERAGGPVLICAADMPFVTPEALRTLLGSAARGTRAAVAVAGGVTQPLLGVFAPAALDDLRDSPAGIRLTDAVEALEPAKVALPAAVVRSIDTQDDLAAAEFELVGA